MNEASTLIQEEAHEDVNVIWGWVIDESMKDEARVTVIATGFEEAAVQARPSAERRVAQMVVNGGFEPRQPARGGRGPGLSSMVSGLNPDDYDIPTFFKNAD